MRIRLPTVLLAYGLEGPSTSSTVDNLNPQGIHLRNPKTCPNKPSHLFKSSLSKYAYSMSNGLYDQPLEDAMGGRPKAQIVLSEVEREQLKVWTRRRKTAQALAMLSQETGCRRHHPHGRYSGQFLFPRLHHLAVSPALGRHRISRQVCRHDRRAEAGAEVTPQARSTHPRTTA